MKTDADSPAPPRIELRGRNLPIGMPWWLGPEGWLPFGHLSLAAFPEGGSSPVRTFAGWLQRDGSLLAMRDLPGDRPERAKAFLGLVEPPEGTTPAEMAERLVELSERWNQEPPRYKAWPGPNSNTFARWLIEESGSRWLPANFLAGRAPWRWYPGWRHVPDP